MRTNAHGGMEPAAFGAVPAAEPPALMSRGSLVASALLQLSQDRAGSLNPYLRRHLSGHIANTGMWPRLAVATGVLDSLDVPALVSDVLSSTTGWQDLPVEIAGTILNRDLIEAYPTQSRASMRLLGQARLAGWSGEPAAAAEAPQLQVTWARRFVRDTVNVPFAGHTGQVFAVVVVPLSDGRTLLATGGEDATVRLWDPTTGTQVGDPLTGHTSRVLAVVVVPLSGGRVLLATGSTDCTVRLWDPVTGAQVGDPLTGHTDSVNAVAVVPLPDGRVLLATGSQDHTVR